MPTVESSDGGVFRVVGEAGYAVYVGEDAPPDLAGVPTLFTATLPADIPITPPGAGTKQVNVVVRAVNAYGLESQNSQVSSFLIDSAGVLQYPPLDPPAGLKVFITPEGRFKVIARYQGFATDPYRATKWRVFVGLSSIDVETDPYTELPAGPTLNHLTLTARPPGLESFVAVALYRALDSSLSPEVATSRTIPAEPDAPEPV